MHEGHFTEKIVDTIMQELKGAQGKKIRSVRVKVGEVYHLVPDSVLMHFEILTKGTPLEGVELQLQEEHVQVACHKCGKTGAIEDHHLLVCPYCYSSNVKTLSGNSINVEAIHLE